MKKLIEVDVPEGAKISIDIREVHETAQSKCSTGLPWRIIDSEPAQEPVAEVTSGYQLVWTGQGPIMPLIEKHGIKVGDKLFAHPEREGDGKQYRLLTSQDIIEAGDQVLGDDTVTWLPLAGWEIGMNYSPSSLMPARRLLAAPTGKGGE